MGVVMKIRSKPSCFCNAQDEREWRNGTEFMLNMSTTLGIARIHEVLEDDNGFYVVTELVSGLDLFELLDRTQQINIEAAKEILFQLLRAIGTLHQQGAVHKDLKLENVMLDPNALVGVTSMKGSPVDRRRGGIKIEQEMQALKLIDFDTVEEWTPQSPKAKSVLGTNQYIAPEAYHGCYSPLSDVFACGVIGYRLISGHFPFNDAVFTDKPGENWVGSPKMDEIGSKLQTSPIDWCHRSFQRHPDAMELLKKMLSEDVCQRPTADEALSHQWFNTPGQKTVHRSQMPVASSTGLVDRVRAWAIS